MKQNAENTRVTKKKDVICTKEVLAVRLYCQGFGIADVMAQLDLDYTEAKNYYALFQLKQIKQQQASAVGYEQPKDKEAAIERLRKISKYPFSLTKVSKDKYRIFVKAGKKTMSYVAGSFYGCEMWIRNTANKVSA